MTQDSEHTNPQSQTTVVLADANVLINFIHIGKLSVFEKLPGYRFLVPNHVKVEVNRKEQADALRKAIEAGIFDEISITDISEMTTYAQYHRTMGQGESACLAIAVHRGYAIASDEKKVFRRTAIKKIGEEKLLTTPDLIVMTIQEGIATAEQADRWKAKLEKKRFKMPFESFRDLL